jgi:hypothetical protein
MRTYHNPYKDINWATINKYKADLHCHTTESDGGNSPLTMINEFKTQGFDVVSLTDHDFYPPITPTWPWSNYDIDSGDIIAIQGNEVGWFWGLNDERNQHHIGSLYNDYGGDPDSNEHETMQGIGEKDGLAIFNHPAGTAYKSSAAAEYDWYLPFFKQYPHLIGLEVQNNIAFTGNHLTGHCRIWDYLLQYFSPIRKIFGFATSDAHNKLGIGACYSLLLSSEKTDASIRTAIEKGHVLAIWKRSAATDIIPSINNITMDGSSIVIDASNYDDIIWYSSIGEVGRGASLVWTNIPLGCGYVRAIIMGTDGIVYTQPFGIGKELWVEGDFVAGQFVS